MGKVVTQANRRRLIELYESGKTVAESCRILEIGYAGAAKLIRRYRQEGEQALEVGFYRCGKKSPYTQEIRDAISSAMQENNRLGAPIIRSRLLAGGLYAKVPHERTIQRWMTAQGVSIPRGRRPKQSKDYATQAHDTWQVDAKERVTTADGETHTYLSITDEATTTFLKGHVFPLNPFDEKC
jgi:hypothetical protein